MKTCARCGAERPLSEFSPNKARKSGVQSRCKLCCADVAKAWRAENRERHLANVHKRYAAKRESLLAATRAWRAKNPEHVKRQKKAWEASNPEKVQTMYRRKRAKGYGLTLAEYDALHDRQGGRCAICEREEGAFSRRLAIDHDHATGLVRGLLCTPCNVIIGHADDSIETLEAAIRYLQKHDRRKTEAA